MPVTLSLLFLLLPAQSNQQPAPSPIRAARTLEVGAAHDIASRQPDWDRVESRIWWGGASRVRPIIGVTSERRAGTWQTRGEIGAYSDWTPRFYTIESFAVAEHVSPAAQSYPLLRGDVVAVFKASPIAPVAATAGYGHMTFGDSRSAQLYSGGIMATTGVTITQVTMYVNRTQPGALLSVAGVASVQRGSEGTAWYGASFGAGRELYRIDPAGTANADFTSVTVAGFARRWFSRSTGVHATAEYQRILNSYQRLSLGARLFVEF
jgi:YaiO family outer membrane protein